VRALLTTLHATGMAHQEEQSFAAKVGYRRARLRRWLRAWAPRRTRKRREQVEDLVRELVGASLLRVAS